MEEAGRFQEEDVRNSFGLTEVTSAADVPAADQAPSSMDLDVPHSSGDCHAVEDGPSKPDAREDSKELGERAGDADAQPVGDEGVDGVSHPEVSPKFEGQGSVCHTLALEEPELSLPPHAPSCGNPNEPFVAVDCQNDAKAGPEITPEVADPNSPPIGDLEGKEDSETHHAQIEPKQPVDGTAEMEGIQLSTPSRENGSTPSQPDIVVDVGADSAKRESAKTILPQDASRSADTPLPDQAVLAEPEEAGTDSVLIVGNPVVTKSDVVDAEYDPASTEDLHGVRNASSVPVPNVASELPASPGLTAKTELQREMELFEAAEREEDERKELLTSVRSRESGGANPSALDHRNERKRPSDSPGTAQRKKRGRKSHPNDVPRDHGKEVAREEEDVCYICFDGGNLVLCDRRYSFGFVALQRSFHMHDIAFYLWLPSSNRLSDAYLISMFPWLDVMILCE